jgi:hypothetical protein
MQQNQTDFRLYVSASDLTMILCAVGAYSHNLEYRDLCDRLQRQATQRGLVSTSGSQ